jgi:putative transposase
VLHATEILTAPIQAGCDHRGTVPPEQAALKMLYFVNRSMEPKGTGRARSVTRWKPTLNAFAVTFADRMSAFENL